MIQRDKHRNGKVYEEGMKIIVKYDATNAPEYTLGKIGIVTEVKSTYPSPHLDSYESRGYRVFVKIDSMEFPLLSNDIEPLEQYQQRINSIKSRFLAHFQNPREVNITRDGLLGVDFVNKNVDIPLFADISNMILKPMYKGRFDKVAAPETSGFYIAPIVASAIGASFIPIRKGSRIPKTWGGYISSDLKVASATKGMGDHFIIPDDSIEAQNRVLLLDDFIRHGNAIFGGINVISKAGGRVVEILTVIDLSFEEGREKLEKEEHIVRSLLSIENYEVLNKEKVRLFIKELFFEKFDPKKKFVDVALRRGTIN
jgi:adenine/guanine phosphoribosyltransferase-like PRPP-binding protein